MYYGGVCGGVCVEGCSLMHKFTIQMKRRMVGWKPTFSNILAYLKVHDPIFQNGDFYSNDASLLKKSWFQISVKLVKPFWCMKD